MCHADGGGGYALLRCCWEALAGHRVSGCAKVGWLRAVHRNATPRFTPLPFARELRRTDCPRGYACTYRRSSCAFDLRNRMARDNAGMAGARSVPRQRAVWNSWASWQQAVPARSSNGLPRSVWNALVSQPQWRPNRGFYALSGAVARRPGVRRSLRVTRPGVRRGVKLARWIRCSSCPGPAVCPVEVLQPTARWAVRLVQLGRIYAVLSDVETLPAVGNDGAGAAVMAGLRRGWPSGGLRCSEREAECDSAGKNCTVDG
jgi:hypothetical protein